MKCSICIDSVADFYYKGTGLCKLCLLKYKEADKPTKKRGRYGKKEK